MDDQTIDADVAPSSAADQASRRDFIKKMLVAGAFAAPVVLTFARGALGSRSMQSSLNENDVPSSVTTTTLNPGPLNSRAQAHFQNAVAKKPALVMSNTTCRPRS